MGWVWLFAIGIASFALLRFGGVSRALGTFTAAALLVGGAGYALQNNSSLPGSPAQTDIRRIDVDPGLVAFRTAIMPATADGEAILATADERMRQGDTGGAAQIMLEAVERRPGDSALWAGLGSVLVAHGAGQMSPASQLAFRRAISVAPEEPGPRFFLGLAHLQSGDLAAARQNWLTALSLAPRNASYNVLIAARLVTIDQLIAMQARQAPIQS